MKAFLFLLLLVPAARAQTYTCASAFSHIHTDVREGQITITSWSGCTLTGTINGVSKQLWADGATCPLRSKVPGTFSIRWDEACGQVLALSDGALPAYCAPTPTPTPTPSPTPVLPCSMEVPDSVSIRANTSGVIAVTLNAVVPQLLPFWVKAVSSNPGQVGVYPAQQEPKPGTSAVVSFRIDTKKRPARIDFYSPCPVSPKSTYVMIQ